MICNDTMEPAIPAEMLETLQHAFADFQARAEKLSTAYAAMQDDFRKVNVELDIKNKELAESLKRQMETQTYLNSILQSMNNGVVGVDMNGTITHFNSAAGSITDYSPGEVLTRHYTDIFTRHDTAAESLMTLVQKESQSRRGEKVTWRKDGTPVPVSFQMEMLRDPQGHVLGAVEILTDLSRIKAMEREVLQSKTMAALGEMSAAVAHEIRNPLGAMGVWASLLGRDLAPDDSRKKLVNKISEGLARLNRIVSNLLVYARPVNTQFHTVRLENLLSETIDFIDIEIERLAHPITTRKEWDQNGTTLIHADPEKIQQVIMNVCLNAIQAMTSGGTLSVSLEFLKKPESEYVSFRIEDTGVGIETERIGKIFDPFHTTKENGTGLGLAIVKKYIELHAGFIDVQSIVGSGTVVKVYLPRAQE